MCLVDAQRWDPVSLRLRRGKDGELRADVAGGGGRETDGLGGEKTGTGARGVRSDSYLGRLGLSSGIPLPLLRCSDWHIDHV